MKLKQETRAYLALAVEDLDRSLQFYTEVLGFDVVKRVIVPDEKVAVGRFSKKGFEFTTVTNGPFAIKLVTTHAQPVRTDGAVDDYLGVRYLGFEVDDFPATLELLRNKGVEFLSPPLESEAENNIPPLVFFRDPDGNLLEIAG